MEGSTLTQRRAECQLKEREIQTDYMMELGARLALVRQIQREQEKEMKRIWFETRKMPSLIEEDVRDVTNRPLTEFMAPCIDSLPPLAFTNRRPIPTMLHPPSPLAIRTQDAQRFIVFSYFVPAECPVSTEATADVSAGKREDLSTDTHLSSMLHRYLPHFFNDDSIPPQQTIEGTTEDSDAPVAISNIKEEDRFYPFSLPPLAQRLIGNSFNVPETPQLAVSATEYQVAKEATAGTATVKRENRWAARILPSVLPPCLPPVFDNDYKLPGAAVEGTNKCPVASEAAASVSTVLQEEFLTDKSPPAPTALSLRLPWIHNIDHKQPEETVENTTECSVDIEACAVASTVKREELMGDKSPVHALPPSLACIHDKDHKQPDQKGRGTTEEVDICPHAHQLVSDANLTLATRNDEPPTPLICVVTKTTVRVGASICRTEDEEPRPRTLEEAKKQVGTIMHLLTKEAVRKICRLFLEVSAALQNENEKLKIKVEQMDKDLKAMVEKGEGREEPKRPTHILHNGTIFKIKPVDLPMMPVNNVKTNTVASALLSMGDVSQVNTVIVQEETTARNTGSSTDPVKERSEVKSGTKTSVIEGAAEAYSKPTETSSLLLSVGDSRGLNTKPSFRDTESKGEPMRAVVPEETGSGRGSHARETSSRTANGTESTENSHGIQQSISKPRKPFKCDICEKTFHANCLLKRHIAVHNKPKGPFKCDICAKTFRLNCMLTQHMQTHSKEKPFSCKVCGKKFRSKTNLKSHEFVHAEVKPFTCLTCGRGFASKYMLDVHQRVHTGEKPYSCTTCGKNFSISQNLKTHIRSVHTERTERPHSCSQCDKTFWRPVELQEHQVVHTGEKPFRCEICQATFSFKENLTRHHRIHTKKRPHTCEVCGKTFIQSTNLKAHMLVHGALKPFMCDVCGKTYLYNYQLRIHKLSHVADGEGHSRTRKNKANQQKQTDQPKPFSCEICLKGFSSIGSLKTHGRIHTGENIYTCSTCGKTFLHKVTFDYHQKLHTGEKPNACGCCGKRFITKQSLKIHELIHTGEKPHKCSDCGKTFGFIGNLKRHERVHTGEKPFSCDVCGTRFRQANHVKTHMQVHTGVRPYSCKRCGKGFSDSRHFKKHNCVSS